KVVQALRGRPYVAHVASVVGGSFGSSTFNQASAFVELKPKDQRPSLDAILTDLRKTLGPIPGIQSFVVPVQNLRIGVLSSQRLYQYVVPGMARGAVVAGSSRIADAMSRQPQTFADVTTDVQNNALEASLVIDQDKARLLGITSDQLRNSLYDGFGTN